MQIIAGELRGRRLHAPRDSRTRPTSGRAREALFSWLGWRIEGASVADLFAGSGALGIEALSRGAVHALFVENAPAALRALRRNLEELELGASARVLSQDVRRALPSLARERAAFDVVFADPPYAAREWMGLAEQREFVELLCPGGVLVVERARRGAAEPAARIVHGLRELVLRESRSYGETVLDWYDLRDPAEGNGERSEETEA